MRFRLSSTSALFDPRAFILIDLARSIFALGGHRWLKDVRKVCN